MQIGGHDRDRHQLLIALRYGTEGGVYKERSHRIPIVSPLYGLEALQASSFLLARAKHRLLRRRKEFFNSEFATCNEFADE